MSATALQSTPAIAHEHDHWLCARCYALLAYMAVCRKNDLKTRPRCCFCWDPQQVTVTVYFPCILAGLRCSVGFAGIMQPESEALRDGR
jgi:hypothetical protein